MVGYKEPQNWCVVYNTCDFRQITKEVSGISPMEMSSYLLDMVMEVGTTVIAETQDEKFWSVKVEPGMGRITIAHGGVFRR